MNMHTMCTHVYTHIPPPPTKKEPRKESRRGKREKEKEDGRGWGKKDYFGLYLDKGVVKEERVWIEYCCDSQNHPC